mmetsp:Transcript_11769/g.26147  ORF Transcript_11769/g.26147 Transcript_11769/m.26147 type:complete len:241 (-) Transcript_11769:21-743(-)
MGDSTTRSVAAQAPRMLVLGGWSPGPLWEIAARRPDIEICEPSIPMPPVGIRWLFNPYLLVLVLYILVLQPCLQNRLARLGTSPAILTALFPVLSLFFAAWLVTRVVRYAIHECMRIARKEIARFEPDVLVGFSWGGGVACWLLAERIWRGPTVLLAPTVQAMSWAAWLPFPTLPSAVHLFHAEHDGFCPTSQRLKLEAMGCSSSVCRGDGHALLADASVEAILRTLARLVKPPEMKERK